MQETEELCIIILVSRLPRLLLLFDWSGNCRRWSSNVIRLNQTFPSTGFVAVQKKFLCTRNTWISARYTCLPRVALVVLPRSGDSLSRKLEEIHDTQVLKPSANPATIRAAASRLYQISGATNIVDFSFSSYFPSYSTGCVSAIEKICPHMYVRLILHS